MGTKIDFSVYFRGITYLCKRRHKRDNHEKQNYNNDLYITNRPGDVWQASYSGKKITLIAPTGKDWGEMKIAIDGQERGIVNLHQEDENQAQQQVFSFQSKRGKHVIQVTSLSGTAAIDALIVNP